MRNSIIQSKTVAALVAATFFSLLTACSQPAPVAAPETPATAAPADAAPTVATADAAKLKEVLAAAKGKVVVVNFWATWCPPCIEEMPYFVELHKRYKDKGVVVISVSADSVDTIDKAVRPFVKDKALPFSVHVLADRDPDAVTAVIGKELSGALPETLVYDKDGALKKFFEGDVTLEELEAEVKPLL